MENKLIDNLEINGKLIINQWTYVESRGED